MQHSKDDNSLPALVRRLCGQDVAACYQCGKCTAGCPMAAQMDQPPHRVMRLVQADDADAQLTLLSSPAIWSCAGCLTCTQRCPKGLDPAAVMDALREMSFQRGLVSKAQRRVLAFHRSFLATIRAHGRMGEFGLVRRYKLASLDFFSDLLVAPAMLKRGKLPLLPHRIRGRDEIRRIFQRTAQRTQEASHE